ncbi:hypothetical protein A2851_01800 [Candidatus Kaiserbacteria bacterium RIFCSPHIGHO2_01_FULL_53_29]|uniref:Uncharacterized protein n=1 Tax=Candidatus Kaiserbacteria bacterium RIFCSPHIGHO2_01_FULL_53_29 TaxID=1798480 RepID=A0A1F6CWR7_9BACT|nr:MAG: hypothetical protein A2851_01800 [Candidatus Kaiserbacteria bacterium RIFCSPHIGHO2_01_FULL_53_29]
MFTDNEGIRSGAVWGLCFIAIAFFFSFQRLINQIFAESFVIKFVSLEIALFLLFLTAIMHVRGYVYAGSKYNLNLLKISAFAQAIILGFFGLSVMASVFVGAFDLGPTKIYDTLIGLFVLLLLIAEILFAFSMIQLYRKIGILALLTAPFPLWVIFIWYGWPALLFFIPSTLLLFKESDSNP